MIDLALLHAVNHTVAIRDWLEDPVTALAAIAVPVFAALTCGLWLLARPYADPRWKRGTVAALFSAGVVTVLARRTARAPPDRARPSAVTVESVP